MYIIASIGSQNTKGKARKIILAGADIIRFNFSRHDLEKNIEIIKDTQEVIAELNSKIKTMADMPIEKIRIGDFDTKTYSVREGSEFVLRSAAYSPDCNEYIPVDTKRLGEIVKINQVITIGDGEVALQVIEILDTESIKVKSMNNGIIQYMRTFNLPLTLKKEQIIENYQKILKTIEKTDCTYIAISYINREINEDIKQLFKTIKKKKIIIKIENTESIKDIANIIKDDFYDLILIDRGELGVNLPYEKIGIIQKKILQIAEENKKAVIVSTQILESTINNYTPYRAEILDITNMVMDKVYGIMLCRETGINSRPAYTISVAKKIIEEAKKNKI